jgi:hypothetical protein
MIVVMVDNSIDIAPCPKHPPNWMPRRRDSTEFIKMLFHYCCQTLETIKFNGGDAVEGHIPQAECCLAYRVRASVPALSAPGMPFAPAVASASSPVKKLEPLVEPRQIAVVPTEG